MRFACRAIPGRAWCQHKVAHKANMRWAASGKMAIRRGCLLVGKASYMGRSGPSWCL